MFSYVDCAGGGAFGPTPPPTPTPDAPVYLQAVKMMAFTVEDMKSEANQVAFKSAIAEALNFGVRYYMVDILNVCPAIWNYDAAERMETSFADACPRRRLNSLAERRRALVQTAQRVSYARREGGEDFVEQVKTASSWGLAQRALQSRILAGNSSDGALNATIPTPNPTSVPVMLNATTPTPYPASVSVNTSAAVSGTSNTTASGATVVSSAAAAADAAAAAAANADFLAATTSAGEAAAGEAAATTVVYSSNSSGIIIEYQIDYSEVWLDERDNILDWMDCQNPEKSNGIKCGMRCGPDKFRTVVNAQGNLEVLSCQAFYGGENKCKNVASTAGSQCMWSAVMKRNLPYYGLNLPPGATMAVETSWAKYVSPVYTNAPTPASAGRRGKKDYVYENDELLDDGMPSGMKIAFCSILGAILLHVVYGKVKVCLDKEKKRQVRKRKHHERALRMGWVKGAENPVEEAKKAAALAAKQNGGMAGLAAAQAAAHKLAA